MTSHSQSKAIRPIGGIRKLNSFQLPSSTSQVNQRNLIENVDRRLDWTYTGIAKEQINSVTTPETMFPNNLLYDYIKYIYDKYQIQDPLDKYGNGRSINNPIGNMNNQDQTFNQASHRSHSSIHNSNNHQNNSQHHIQNNLSFGPSLSNLNAGNNSSPFKRREITQQPPIIQTLPQVANQINNSSRHGYDKRSSLPVTYIHNQTFPQNIQQTQPQTNTIIQQFNSIHHSPNPFSQQQQTQSIERSQIQTSQIPYQRNHHQRNNTELQSINRTNRISDLGEVSKSYMYDGSNTPYRPSILDTHHGIKRHSQSPQKSSVPLQYSTRSRFEIQEDQGRKRLIQHTPTGISRDYRNSQDQTDENFSIAESNRNREQYPYISRQDNRRVVSKSTTFNRENPQYERNNHRQYQPFAHRPTGSDFQNLRSINNNNDLRSQTNTGGFQTPLRQQKKSRDEATTQSRKIERPIAGQINTTNIKGSRGQLHQQRETSIGVEAYSTTTNLSGQIPSIYRYCFVCQHPILEHNISIHEEKCAGFKSLYDKSFDQILRMLVQKIKRMQHKIQSILNDQQQDRLKNLRSSVSTWMGSIRNVSQNGQNSIQMQRNYQQIMKCFRSKQMQLLQLSHKLKWFLSIRQNIKNSFNV